MVNVGSGELLLYGLAAVAVAAYVLMRRRAAPDLPEAELMQLRKRGALVLDVRSAGEFQGGHLPGSVNIPLGSLTSRMGELKKARPIITVCASGARSGLARRQLLAAGFQEVHNAGPWQTLRD